MIRKLLLSLALIVSIATAQSTEAFMIIGPFDETVPAPAPTYIVSEDWETNYSPSTPPCGTGTWTVVNGMDIYSASPSPAPLRGARSAQVKSSNQTTYCDFTGQSDVWFFLLATIPVDFVQTMRLYDPVSGNGVNFGNWGAANLRITSCGKDAFPLLVTSASPMYYWFHYTKGTGSNSALEVYWSSTDTKPGSPNYSYTDGNCTNDLTRVSLTGGGGNSSTIAWDYIRVSNTTIGSAPL